MNILPFVFTFLILMGIASMTLFKGVSSTALESRCVEGSILMQRAMRSKLAKKTFRDITKTEHEPNSKKPKTPKSLKKTYESPRKAKSLSEASKFTLSTENQLLYEPAARLLKLLYGHAPFYEERLEYKILDEILWKKDRKDFVDPFPEIEPLKTIYYKMLKGTNIYDLQTKNGYPPLSDFFSLGKQKIFFYHASLPVLTAILGEKLTKQVIAEEKAESERRGEVVSMGEALFKPFVEKKGPKFEPDYISSIFAFSKSGKGKTITIVDEKTGITARR